MTASDDFQLFVKLLSRYRPGATSGRDSACLGAGPRGVEFLARGEEGIRELEGADGAVVHLWDPAPRSVDAGLRARGFEELWINHLLEASPSAVRSTGRGDVRELSDAGDRAALARVLGESEAPRLDPPRVRAVQVTGRSGEPLGGASFTAESGVLYLADVFVHPHHRLGGAGSSLLAALAQVAKREGADRLWALSTSDARRFYARCGFEPRICITTYQRTR